MALALIFFFSSRRRHTRFKCDWSSDVCSSDLGGCHGDPEIGLTAFGQAVVREMNRIGMLVDATHCSRRTTFDFFELSEAPVVFSHSVPAGLKKHPRNVGLGYSTDAIKGILGGTSIEWQTRSGARLRAK